MNFDDAFKHCQEGVATEEEKQFVKEQLAKANEFLKSESIRDESPVKEADVEDVRKAKKKFKWQYIVIPICSIVCVLLVIAAILGGVFGSAASYAKDAAVFKKAACVDIARQNAYEFVTESPTYSFVVVNGKEDFQVDDIEPDFNYNGKNIKSSYYAYIIELEVKRCDFDIEIEVDTRTGDCKVIKVDR